MFDVVCMSEETRATYHQEQTITICPIWWSHDHLTCTLWNPVTV